MEPHNSYFIGTDVVYQYMVLNRCAERSTAQTGKAFPEAELTRRRERKNREEIRVQLEEICWTTTAICRSSFAFSIMEDGCELSPESTEVRVLHEPGNWKNA